MILISCTSIMCLVCLFPVNKAMNHDTTAIIPAYYPKIDVNPLKPSPICPTAYLLTYRPGVKYFVLIHPPLYPDIAQVENKLWPLTGLVNITQPT
ncbi:hypothetical protein F4859DRAFT_85703 [Xylaria cf. heliscus]|nr:hypothetical protein F4859DRAFT_85703 [Xylaria cf. heliscus]